jgi:hypothetical protein
MAITGKSYVPIGSGRRSAGHPDIMWVAEQTSVTGLRGTPVTLTGGYLVQMAADGVLLWGFLDKAGANSTAAGNMCPVQRIKPGVEYTGTLKATLTQAMVGSVCNLVEGSSTWYLDTSTSVSSVAQCYIVGPAEGFAIGDINPIIYFTVDHNLIQDTEAT